MIEKLLSNQKAWDSIVEDGLNFLIEQWHQEFTEAAHVMYFPREQGFSSPQEEHYGDVFQRALIADVFCDAKEILAEQFQPIIDREVNYLLGCQRDYGVRGWSYFPHLPELPPDADDLAQVMQVLLRSGYQAKVEKYCEVPLSILLQDNLYPDGSFETWILPSTNLTPEQHIQSFWVEQAWGKGPDPDVMANLLYALKMYNSERFAQVIERGVAYLESQQKQDGSWQSSWYHGPYYGTYVCLRLLTSVNSNSPAISRAVNFLYQHQQTDGGWGIEETSEPLSTALALLSLGIVEQKAITKRPDKAAIAKNESKVFQVVDSESITKASSYLQNCRKAEQYWSSCKFIRMELGRASNQVRAILFYGSQTITTAFVLKAALAWKRLKKSLFIDM